MTTKHSPLNQLRKQADMIAAKLKAAERGEIAFKGGARNKDTTKVGIVMDDKIITIDIAWVTIKETSEAGLSEYILKQMRETREAAH